MKYKTYLYLQNHNEDFSSFLLIEYLAKRFFSHMNGILVSIGVSNLISYIFIFLSNIMNHRYYGPLKRKLFFTYLTYGYPTILPIIKYLEIICMSFSTSQLLLCAAMSVRMSICKADRVYKKTTL